MKRLSFCAFTFFLALVIAAALPVRSHAWADDDSTASDRASAAAAAKSGDADKEDSEPQPQTSNVIPYVIPKDFEGAKRQIQRCADVTDNILRIRCYDQLASDLGVIAKNIAIQKEAEIAKFGFWRVTARANQVGEMLTSARLTANKPYQSLTGVERNAEFVISCKTQSTDAYVDFKGMIGAGSTDFANKLPLVYNTDNEQGVMVNWDVSFDRFAAFAPHALDFVRSLHGKKTLVFQGKPEPDNTVTLVFTLDGLENVLKILYDRCYKDSPQ